MCSNPSPRTISSHHCWRGKLLSLGEEWKLTQRWVEQEAEGRSERKKGVSCDESLPSGKQFQKPPQSSQHLSESVLCAERNCGKWSTKPHLIAHRPDAVQRSEEEPCANMSNTCQSLQDTPMGGLKISVQVLLFFKWSKLYTTVFFNNHSLAFKTKFFFSSFSIALWLRSIKIR